MVARRKDHCCAFTIPGRKSVSNLIIAGNGFPLNWKMRECKGRHHATGYERIRLAIMLRKRRMKNVAVLSRSATCYIKCNLCFCERNLIVELLSPSSVYTEDQKSIVIFISIKQCQSR